MTEKRAVTPSAMIVQIEEEGSAGLGDLAADTLPHHMEDGDGQPEERTEEDDEASLLDAVAMSVPVPPLEIRVQAV